MFSEEDDRAYHIGSKIAGVVQGYRPQVDWGGDAGSATIVLGSHNVRVATSGWRRRCLYLLLLALLALSLVNLSLTLLVLKTTYFNVDGMGELHVTVGGLDMEGSTRFLGKITAAEVRSKKGEKLRVEGYYNLSLQSTSTHPPDAYLHIGVSKVTGGSKEVQVRSISGEHLYTSHLNGSTVGARRFSVTGSKGAVFQGSIQTPELFSKGVTELRLESVTKTLLARASEEVSLDARDGDISVISTSNVTLKSRTGIIRFDNTKIYMSGLLEGKIIGGGGTGSGGGTGGGGGGGGTPTTTASPQETQLPPPGRESPSTTPLPPSSTSSSSSSSSSSVKVYQVCVCPNGRLFLMEAEAVCVFADACR